MATTAKVELPRQHVAELHGHLITMRQQGPPSLHSVVADGSGGDYGPVCGETGW